MQYLKKNYHCQWTLLRGEKPKWIFHNLGNLLRPLELIPALRERVVPTEWQVRTVLCISRAKVIPPPAPPYRQHALISYFLDLANLSIQEEAALATNWIKDRSEGLKLLRWLPGRDLQGVYQNLTSDVHCAMRRETIDLSRESIGIREFSPHVAVLRRHFFAEYAFPVLHVTSENPWWRF